jgi:two-component system sensor histidine kinase HydH
MNAQRRWDLWLAAAGAALGISDTTLLVLSGVEFTVAGRDATLAVAATFTSSFTLLGCAIGALLRARGRARADAETIRAQLAEIERTQRALAQQEKLAAIGRLAAGVAHEVRNPLTVIRASAAMVRESFEPGEEPYRACGFVLEEIDRLNALITALLTFARPARPRLASVSVEKTLDRALELASPELRKRAIDVEREALGPLPDLRADADLLAQVLLDLLVNAAEAIERGGRVRVRMSARGGELAIDVADSGPGVAPGDAARVFEPFFTTKPRGTGLGLAMALQIVESHGGAIDVVQGAGAGPGGAGACFRVRLPVAQPPGAGAPA